MIKFHKVGTKHKSYVKRFEAKVGHLSHFEIYLIDAHKINLHSNGVILEKFTSKSTFNQFIRTLISLGMIKADKRGFKVLAGTFDWNVTTNAIFLISPDKKIKILRDSRKVSLLAKLDLLNKKAFPIKITKTKGDFRKDDAISEASLWEQITLESLDKTIDVLERIKNEYKI